MLLLCCVLVHFCVLVWHSYVPVGHFYVPVWHFYVLVWHFYVLVWHFNVLVWQYPGHRVYVASANVGGVGAMRKNNTMSTLYFVLSVCTV